MPSDTGTAADGGGAGRGGGERRRWRRWTGVVAVIVVLALVGAALLGVATVRRSFPQTSGTVEVPGLVAEATVVRDAHGIPQVYADTAGDLFYAQGYVQAQDRFFEMDVRRHLTAGRLSEMFGEDTLETDMVVRTLGWRRVAEREVDRLDDETVGYLEAFSAGVNAYLQGRSPGELSLEYTLLSVGGRDVEIEPWTPVDSVAWLKAMAWDLRANLQDEIDRAMASTRLDAEEIAQLYPAYPYDRHRPVVEGGSVVGGAFSDAPARLARFVPSDGTRPEERDGVTREALTAQLAAVRDAVDAVPAVLGTGEGVGSNAWVVDGARSATGSPILANDPHLATSLPGVWYQMGLHCTVVTAECPFDVSGFTFAGFPGVVIGHNQEIAWGFTNLAPDVADLYLEAVDGERYRHGDEWRDLERREETIEVAGGEQVTFTVRTSVHGPLISDVGGRFASVGANAPVGDEAPPRGEGYAVALSWTALTPTRTAQAVFGLNRATSWPQFRRALRFFAVPSQNVVYADRSGNIGYQVPGLFPVRGTPGSGGYPAPGWDPAYDWTGRYVPFDQLPSVLNPDEGFVASANQPPAAATYPHDLAESWDPGYRSQRIVELLEAEETLDVADMARIQLDDRHGFAPVLVPYLLDVDPGTAYYREGQEQLARWNFRQPPRSSAAAYYNAVWVNLLRLTFADQLPETVEVTGSARWFEVVRRLLEQPEDPWWDDVGTERTREGRDDILRQALREARDELVRRQSRRPTGWSWGHQHTLTLENQTLGQSGLAPVAGLLNRGPWQVGGSGGVVNATSYHAGEGFEVVWAPSMRMVVSLADLDDSTWVNLTGASGHAFHRHYTDQTDLWAEGRTLAWPFGRRAVDGAAEETLTLLPERSG